MKSRGVYRWYLIHKWTSLLPMVFLLMLCITGLPLIFKHEIDELLAPHPELPKLAQTSERPPIDTMIRAAQEARPGEVVQFFYYIPDQPAIGVGTAAALDSPPEGIHLQAFDLRTGQALTDGTLMGSALMRFILQLHKDMFAGLAGMLFLGLMGVLLVVSTVSGIVLYAPYLGSLSFGAVRTEKSQRIKWLDLHNFLGIATFAWVCIVSVTGVINTLSTPILALWQMGQLADMTRPYKDLPPVTKLSSVDAAIETAREAAPGMTPLTISFPGTMFTSKHHYAIYMQGNTALTSRLIKPVLIDAQTGALTDVRSLPLYVSIFLLSQPLHFGDYGGLPLKIIWAILDVIAIVVLGSGLYLWFVRSKAVRFAQLKRISQMHQSRSLHTREEKR